MQYSGLILIIIWLLLAIAALDSCSDTYDSKRITAIEKHLNMGETK